MEFIKGLRRDERASQQTPNSWRWAKNMLLGRGYKSVSNEPGFELDIVSVNGVAATSLPKQINGIINTGTSSIVFSVSGVSSEIGISIDGVYTTIIDDPILNFSISRPIEGVFKYSFNQQLIISWWEGTDLTANPVRVLNTVILPFAMSGFQLLNPTDVKLLELFAPAKYPIVDMIGTEDGGSLTTGEYYILTNYEKADGSVLGWTMPTNGVAIYNEPFIGVYEQTDGAPPGSPSNKRIHINITNIDTAYSYLRIGYVYSNNNIITAFEALRLPIQGTVIDTNITQNSVVSVPLAEALSYRISYPFAKTGTVLSDRLHLGNVRTKSDLDYQKFANNIKVKWVQGDYIGARGVNKGSYKDGRVEFYDKNFQADEVYAYYIGLINNDLTISNVYHIPGRASLSPSETALVTGVEELSIAPTGKEFQFHNTAKRDGTMGYWQNENESYANTANSDIFDATGQIGTLRNTPVRHHKFPSLEKLNRWGYPLSKTFSLDAGGNSPVGSQILRYTGVGVHPTGIATSPSVNYNSFKFDFDKVYFADFIRTQTTPDRHYRFQFNRGNPAYDGNTGALLNHNGSLNTFADDDENGVTINNCRIKFGYDQIIDLEVTLRFQFHALNAASVPYSTAIQANVSLFDKNGIFKALYVNTTTAFTAAANKNFQTSTVINGVSVLKDDYLLFDVRMIAQGIGAAGDQILFQQNNPVNGATVVRVITSATTPPLSTEASSTEVRCATRPLGISLSNIYIPPTIEANIQGFIIFYALRDNSNITVVGQSPALYQAPVFEGFPHNGTETFNNATISRPPRRALRTYDFVALRDKVSIAPSYIRFEHLISEATFTGVLTAGSEGTRRANITSNIGGVDPNFRGCPFNFANITPIPTGDIRKIKDFSYVPRGVITTNVNNIPGEEFARVETVNVIPDFLFTVFNTPPSNMAGTHSFPLVNLKLYKIDVYNSFVNQEIVSTGQIFLTNGSNNYSVGEVYGGDIYRTPYGFKALEGASASYADTVVYTMVESSAHIALRHDDGTIATKYYPKSSSTDTVDSVYLYNRDYSKVNNLFPVFPVNPSKPKTNIFPHRIPRSIVSRSEEYSLGWSTFLANDYYEMPKDKGEIWKLGVLNKELMINQKLAFFVARVKDLLATDSFKIYTGTGDIFDRAPDEIVPITGGYAGCQSQWCAFSCKHGWVFADKSQGKIFVFSGQLDEISNDGLSVELFDRLRDGNLVDNPFQNFGLCGGFDNEWNRLIISNRLNALPQVNSAANNFTLSYAYDIKAWSSNHDYFPNYIYSNREKLYSVRNLAAGSSEIYRHNIGANGKFYGGIIYPSYIDIPFTKFQGLANIFNNVIWTADLEDSVTGATIRDKTFTHMMIYNENQCSGMIDLRNINKNWFTKLIRNNEGIWSFNGFRDILATIGVKILDINGNLNPNILNLNLSWFKKNLFIEKLAIVRFFYDNTDANTFYLMDTDFNKDISSR